MSQWCADERQPRIVAMGIVMSAGALVSLLDMPHNSLFAQIASACPPNASRQRCVEQAELVKSKVDQLLRELYETKRNLLRIHGGTEPDEPDQLEDDMSTDDDDSSSYEPDGNEEPDYLVHMIRMQALDDTIVSLRRLSQLVLYSRRRTESSKSWVQAAKRIQCRQFYANFHLQQYGRPSSISADCSCMLLCDSAVGTSAVWLSCCNFKVHLCYICLSKHAYVQSRHGVKSFFNCSHCRAELPLYRHLDAGAGMSTDENR
jgi:hypothetical protein